LLHSDAGAPPLALSTKDEAGHVSAHRFKIEISGTTMHGLAFGTEAELDEFMAGRGTGELSAVPAARQEPVAPLAVIDEPRAQGRPSFNRIIGQAAKAVTLNPSDTLTSRANQVLRHIAKSRPADAALPSQRCVINFLADRSHGKNYGKKYGNKKRVRKCSAAGGI
jgi:hypothetical protein